MCMIELKNDIPDTFTNAAGVILFYHLKPAFESKTITIISFKDVTTSSSFLNSSFGELIDSYGYDSFKNLIKMVNVSTGQKLILENYFKSLKINRVK